MPAPLRTPLPGSPESAERVAAAERRELLARLEGWLEIPMLVLGFVWLALLIWEFTRGLSPRLGELKAEIAALRHEVRALSRR